MFIPHQFRRAVEQIIEGMKSRILTFGAFNVGSATGAGAGDAAYSGDLQPYRNSTLYTGYVYVPLPTPLTSTSWDGDSFSTTGTTLIDLSAVFGVPAGVKAVDVELLARDSVAFGTPGNNVLLGATGVYWSLSAWPLGGDAITGNRGNVPCDANGDMYYNITASGVGTMDVWIRIFGYYI